MRERRRRERVRVGAKVDRLRLKMGRVGAEIEEVRAHGVGLRAQIEVMEREYKQERWEVE